MNKEKHNPEVTKNPTARFSDRVDDYVRYRPTYPKEILNFLGNKIGLQPHQTVADIGSGTGIFTRSLLDFGLKVYAVEPNEEMRRVAETDFAISQSFTSVVGTAEETKLHDSSVSHIFSAQAFHWFKPELTRTEWLRIARPNAYAVLLWNTVKMDGSDFQVGYEDIKERFGIDFKEVSQKYVTTADTKKTLFGGKGPKKVAFDNFQILDFDGLKGRLLSSSYAPKEGHKNYEPMIQALRDLFDRCQVDRKITMRYDTEVFFETLQ